MDAPFQTELRTIILCAYGADVDDFTFAVQPNPPVKTGRTKVFPTRATLGPTDPDVDDTLTTLNFMDVSSGMGIYTIKPISDLSHYWWGIAEAEGTDGWTAAREAIMRQPSVYSGNCVPLGRIGASMYALWGTDIHQWDPDALTWGASLDTVGTVVNTEGIVSFNGRMFFPLGSSGYAYVSESAPGTLGAVVTVAGAATPAYSATPGTSNPRVWAFAVHEDILYALTTAAEGYALVGSLTGNNNDWSWDQYLDTARSSFIKIESSFEPKTMAVFPNAQSEQALWTSGRRGLKSYDSGKMRWVDTTLTDVPPHPDFGRAMKVFRPGEALWISGGGGDVIQYTVSGAIVPASGPGGARDGMPAGKRGSAISFATDLAHLYCLVQGETAEGESAAIVEDSESGDPLYLPGAVATTSVIANTGKGWHPKWESAVPGGVPTKIVVADVDKASGATDYRLFWGLGEECWTMTCRLTTHSARQAVQTGTGERFRSSAAAAGYQESYLEWGPFNGGSIAVHKLASHAAIIMEHATATEYVEYQYYTDHQHDDGGGSSSWITLGSATQDAGDEDPRTVLPFGLTGDGLFSEGLNYHWIRQRLRFISGNATRPPIVTALSLSYLPVPGDAATKAYTVPLPVDRCQITGKTAETIINQVESLLSPSLGEEKFLYLQEGQRQFRAYISSISYGRMPTVDGPGALTLSIIEIPTGKAGVI